MWKWLTLLICTCGSAHADYRAFELVIKDATSGQERIVIATLDPLQYRHYFPVKLSESIFYRQTWRCRGNTSGFKSICLRPEPAVKPPTPQTSPN